MIGLTTAVGLALVGASNCCIPGRNAWRGWQAIRTPACLISAPPAPPVGSRRCCWPLQVLRRCSSFRCAVIGVDDYHGRYRVWIWTAIACLLVSLGETDEACLFRSKGCAAVRPAWSGVSESIVWPTVVGTLLAVAGVRLLVEVWRCRGAVAPLLTSSVAFLVSAATNNGWLIHVAELRTGRWSSGAVGSSVT